jgi:hypothetical protein
LAAVISKVINIIVSLKYKSNPGFKQLLEPQLHVVLVGPLACLLCNQVQIVRAKQSHQNALLVNDSLRLRARALCLEIVAIEAVLEAIKHSK